MGSEYFVYSEMKTGDSGWLALGPMIPKYENGVYTDIELCETYQCLSHSSFISAFEQLSDIGRRVSFSELSKDLQIHLKRNVDSEIEDGDIVAYKVSLEDLYKATPLIEDCENNGYVLRDEIFDYKYNGGSIESCLSLEDYRKLPYDEKEAYAYFSWDDYDSWSYHFKEIMKEIEEDIKRWRYINYISNFEAIRIIVFEF